MTIYTVSIRRNDNEHAGYHFVASKRKAEALLKQEVKRGNTDSEILTPHSYPITKLGMLAALNRLGGHPDNG